MKYTLSNEDVYEVITLSDSLLHKSIISFMFTTGLKHTIVRDLKIKDLLCACEDYLDDGEGLDDLLKKEVSIDFIPCWRISDGSSVGVTFTTPEATQFLFEYLKDRQKYVEITDESYLFKNYTKNDVRISDDKEPLKKDFILKFLGRKKKEFNEFNDGDVVDFSADNLINNFVKICKKNLYANKIDKIDISLLIDLFQGKTTKENKFYNRISEVKEYYMNLMTNLTISPLYKTVYSFKKDTDDNISTSDTNSIDSTDFSDFEIKQVINSYYQKNIMEGNHVDYNEYFTLCNEVYDIVIYYMKSKYRTFILDDYMLDSSFKKAKAHILIEDYSDEICIEVNEDNVDVRIEEIKDLINKMNIDFIDDEHLDNVLHNYLGHMIANTCHDVSVSELDVEYAYGSIIVTSSTIKDVIDLCMDGFFKAK